MKMVTSRPKENVKPGRMATDDNCLDSNSGGARLEFHPVDRPP
jgi:hypothetical protein